MGAPEGREAMTLEEWLARSRQLNPQCGCDQRGEKVFSCSYHEGAEDAWEDAYSAGAASREGEIAADQDRMDGIRKDYEAEHEKYKAAAEREKELREALRKISKSKCEFCICREIAQVALAEGK